MKNNLFIYNTFILPVSLFTIRFLSILNKQYKDFIRVRKEDFKRITEFEKTFSHKEKKIWFHSASLGEYEQAKPILKKIRKEYPEIKIIISFFSTSGYKYAPENNELYDIKIYLPFDKRSYNKTLLKIIKPDLVIYLGYDVWPNFSLILSEEKIPQYLINGTIKENSFRLVFKKFFKKIYNNLNGIIVVSETMKERYSKIYPSEKIIVKGDSRIDNVFERKKEIQKIISEEIIKDKFVFIIGSSHFDDEKIILPVLKHLFVKIKNLIIIFVPHNVSKDNIEDLEKRMNNIKLTYLKYSDYEREKKFNNEEIILIDKIGLLFHLYGIADVAYIGGSFKEGIHNVMEPAVFGLPIICGPIYHNSNEAAEMREKGYLFSIKNSEEFEKNFFELYNNIRQQKEQIKKDIIEYMEKKRGTADYIFNNIIKKEIERSEKNNGKNRNIYTSTI
ncbi:MAG TPA: glycosyltransferase N-terminal domain-containing protein [bacterium]|nr:glycosyltransferase N-terminal domain-containing protein [bacterium]HOL47386.1 glycosyltransferase N-terminal domain-containing protein [bacterium]HPQ18115.1 glycosyltransferase N-terminal domain-containing protein [bacterium]